MLIGIDASRAFVKDKTGTENYSYELLREMLQLPEAKKYQWRLYVKKSVERVQEGSGLEAKASRTDPRLETLGVENVEVVEIGWKRLWTQGGLALECLRRPPDVLWIPAHTLPVVRRGKIKTVVTIHGLEYEYLPEYNKFPQSLYLNKSTEYAVKHADRLIAVSNWTKSELVNRLGADEKKITVVYEGVGRRFVAKSSKLAFSGDLRHSSPSRSGLKAKASRTDLLKQVRYKYDLPEKYVLFVGTIQPRKNLVRLIEAFAMMTKGSELARGVPNLVIAGKKGWLAEEIYEAPKKYRVEDRVKFIGRVADADLPVVYKMANLFAWPSLMEGFGLPLLEAMQMGVPVISSNRGALVEVGGKAALQIDPENIRELAEAMKLVLENQELREGLIEKGYKQVKKFSWAKAAKETFNVLTS